MTTTNAAVSCDNEQGDRQPLVLRFCLPEFPVSVNKLYAQKYNQRRGHTEFGPSDEHLLWRTRMGEYVPPRNQFPLQPGNAVHVDMEFHFPFSHKNGSTRRLDASNFCKAILDLVSRRLGFDDLFVRSGCWSSVDADNRRVVVTLREVQCLKDGNVIR